jgi:hypothetical protein
MSETLVKVQALAANGEVRVSLHGYDELAADSIFFADVLDGVSGAVLIEDYPQTAKGPCVLVLQKDSEGRSIHVVWGILAGKTSPAVLVTAHRPDPLRWSSNYMTRKKP